jgi:hypothetical protein
MALPRDASRSTEGKAKLKAPQGGTFNCFLSSAWRSRGLQLEVTHERHPKFDIKIHSNGSDT